MKVHSWIRPFISIGLLAGCWASTPGLAQARHPWLAESPKLAPEAFFTNIKHGDSVSSPFVVRFGMNYWGISPADHDHPNTGHHHLLINTELPIPITKEIAKTDNYLHFGKGQMETILDLKPGKHTLQLLLADHKHVPHMVFSKQITVNVTSQTGERTPNGFSTEPALEIIVPKDNAMVGGVFHVQFHASNLNISHSATKLKSTAHFVLNVQAVQAGGKKEKISFPNGQTDAWLKLPFTGAAKMWLEAVDNYSRQPLKLKSKEIDITVNAR